MWKRTFWHVRPRRLKAACASAQSDQSLRCQHDETMHTWLSKTAPSENSDQTARMRRLIWIFTGRTCTKGRFLMLRLIQCITMMTFPFLNEVRENSNKILEKICIRSFYLSPAIQKKVSSGNIMTMNAQRDLDVRTVRSETAVSSRIIR